MAQVKERVSSTIYAHKFLKTFCNIVAEMQFSYHLAMAGGFNIRIYILLFFAFWTMMTSVMLLNMFNANNIYKIRCEISELEHKFSFDQIHQLTAKRDGDTA